jgi:hypothetical protein
MQVRAWAAFAAILALATTSAHAVTGGQLDNFEDATDQGWSSGNTAATNIATGGPAGLNDNYLQVNSSGSGSAGGRLVVFNTTQWAGDYTPITSVAMDFKNGTAVAMPMRIALKPFTGNSPGYVSSTAFNVPADNLWHHAVFNINAGSLTAVGTSTPLPTFLTNVAELRLLASASGGTVVGDALAGPLGVDNVTAVAVPEPSVLGLLLVSAATSLHRRKRGG